MPFGIISLDAPTGEGWVCSIDFGYSEKKERPYIKPLLEYIREKTEPKIQRCFDFGIKFLLCDMRPKIRKSKIITMV